MIYSCKLEKRKLCGSTNKYHSKRFRVFPISIRVDINCFILNKAVSQHGLRPYKYNINLLQLNNYNCYSVNHYSCSGVFVNCNLWIYELIKLIKGKLIPNGFCVIINIFCFFIIPDIFGQYTIGAWWSNICQLVQCSNNNKTCSNWNKRKAWQICLPPSWTVWLQERYLCIHF